MKKLMDLIFKKPIKNIDLTVWALETNRRNKKKKLKGGV